MRAVVIGVDPHKRSVTIEVVDRQEKMLGSGRFTTDQAGYAGMRTYAKTWPHRVWAVEGANGVGRPLAQRLLEAGEQVLDVPAKLAARARLFDTCAPFWALGGMGVPSGDRPGAIRAAGGTSSVRLARSTDQDVCPLAALLDRASIEMEVDAMSHRNWLVLLLVALLAGCTNPTNEATAKPATAASAPASASASPSAEPGTVVVTVRDLAGAAGGGLAGVLFSGPEAMYPDTRVVGGFGVAVEEDSFRTTQTIAEPGEAFQGAFPYVTRIPLQVAPGTYTLALWAAPKPLHPYSRWVPGDTPGLRGCEVTFTATAEATQVSVYGLPPFAYIVRPPRCSTSLPAALAAGGSQFNYSVGITVPAGFQFHEASRAGLADHARLVTALPGAVARQQTWQVDAGGNKATVSRLTLAPDFPLPDDPAALDLVLQKTAGAVHGSDLTPSWISHGTRGASALVIKGSGVLNTYAWTDMWHHVWVLSEATEHQFGQHDWPILIDALIGAQG